MQFTEKAFGRRIKTIILINIQGAKRLEYNFEKQGVTRLFAPSEIGKSILTKAMQFMILGQSKQKDIRDSILRDFTSQSMISIKMYNGREVVFVYKNNTPLYIIKDEEGKATAFQSHTAPKEVLDELGYYVDLEEDICLNIRESEPLALVHTSERTNSAIFNCVLENPVIDKALVNVEKRMELIKQSKNLCMLHLSSNKSTLGLMKESKRSEEELDNEIIKLQNLKNIYSNLTNTTNNLRDVLNTISNAKSIKYIPLNEDKIERNISIYCIMNSSILTSFTYLRDSIRVILNSKEREKLYSNINIENVRIKVDFIRFLIIPRGMLGGFRHIQRDFKAYKKCDLEISHLKSQYSKIQSIYNFKKTIDDLHGTIKVIDKLNNQHTPNIDLVNTKISNLNSLDSTQKTLSKLLNCTTLIIRDSSALNLNNMNELKVKYDAISNQVRNINSIYDNINNLIQYNRNYIMTTENIKTLKAECKVCPLCDTPFTEGDSCYV